MYNLDDLEHNIIYVDTWQFTAHYIPKDDRIEISKYLTKYQHLHNFIRLHELKHKDYFNKDGYKSLFKHIWLDLKCYYTFKTNKIINSEYKEFKKIRENTIKSIIFEILYLFILPFAQIPISFYAALRGKK